MSGAWFLGGRLPLEPRAPFPACVVATHRSEHARTAALLNPNQLPAPPAAVEALENPSLADQ